MIMMNTHYMIMMITHYNGNDYPLHDYNDLYDPTNSPLGEYLQPWYHIDHPKIASFYDRQPALGM